MTVPTFRFVTILRLREAIRFARSYVALQGGGARGIWRMLRKAFSAAWTIGPVSMLRNAARAGRVEIDEPVFIAPLGLPPTAYPFERSIKRHTASVDVVVCVHNALEDVRRCLGTLLNNTGGHFRVVIVDDGSGAETASFLQKYAADHAEQPVILVRNDTARGYTLAANQGMRASKAEYVVLLNSDTAVSPDWLDRMIMCAESAEKVGIVGPLSNTASWQSIPEIEQNGDWADNSLPSGTSIPEVARSVASMSAQLYPPMGFLNGFCLLLKRPMMEEIGLFDEDNFAQGYGEENDYCLRAREAGWILALADDVYVYHAQSKSYSHERRKQLSERAGEVLAKKHGSALIDQGVKQCRNDRVLEGIRSRARALFEILAVRAAIGNGWAGKRVCYVLPAGNAGGGSNVVLTEARALQSMGIDVAIVNLEALRKGFEANYPNPGVPVIYVASQDEVAEIASAFDAAIATHNTTVSWLASLAQPDQKTVLGYYVQDFEPHFYDMASDADRALASYTLIKDMVLFTKTEWNRNEVMEQTGADCRVIGASADIWLFRPRPRSHPSWPARAIRICAMIRPSSPRRAPRLTMEILGKCARVFGDAVEIVLFGVPEDDPEFFALPNDFPYSHMGLQRPEQLASLFNEVDIFVDFSDFQAMGLTAMEAMACGVAAIVPKRGGTQSYARDNENCLVVDTENSDACITALSRLIKNDHLRSSLQRQAIIDMGGFSPEKAAISMMQALFDDEGGAEKESAKYELRPDNIYVCSPLSAA
jgi:GT2 family glycosyltransferase